MTPKSLYRYLRDNLEPLSIKYKAKFSGDHLNGYTYFLKIGQSEIAGVSDTLPTESIKHWVETVIAESNQTQIENNA